VFIAPLAIEHGLLFMSVIFVFEGLLLVLDFVGLNKLLNLVKCAESLAPKVLQLLNSLSN
jgi:hypothetical protein